MAQGVVTWGEADSEAGSQEPQATHRAEAFVAIQTLTKRKEANSIFRPASDRREVVPTETRRPLPQ